MLCRLSTKSKELPRAASPEEVGVSSALTEQFLHYIKEQNLEFHSFMVIRHGKIAVEWYNEPYTADTSHSMYSVSKTFSATAIGFAVSEGLLSLDDKVLDFFPEYTPKSDSPYFDKLTVRSLITMTSGKQTNMLEDKGKIDWIEDFINSPWVFEPGTQYLYVNENIYMLCAIINRVAKTSVVDYLMPRLFEPLGIERPFWETDQNGIEAGGWGLYIKTMDLAKVMTCYLHEGKYKNKQVLPKDWVKEATVNQLGDIKMPSKDKDCCAGYGYCIWMDDTEPYSYRADGMFSQFGINFPSLDATIISTAAIPCEDEARAAIWAFFPAAFADENGNGVEVDTSSVNRPVASKHSVTESRLIGKTIKVRKKILLNIIGMPVSMLPLAVTFMMSDRAGNIDNIKFNFGDHECDMTWDEGDERNTICCGMDGRYRYGTMTLGKIKFKICANAEWIDDINLKVMVRPVETVGMRTLNFLFRRNNKVTITPTSTPSTYKIVDTLSRSFTEIIKNPLLSKICQKAIQIAPPLAEPKHYGKIV